MMRRFVSNNVAFLFFVIIITIDASRILYLPLPKIHSSHHELQSSPIVHESEIKPHKEKLINDEFIPLSAMERNMYPKQEDSEKRDTFDWEALVDKKAIAKHHINVNEVQSGNGRQFNHLTSADQETQKSARIYTNNNDINAALNELSQLNGNQDVSEPWIVDNAVGQTALLQANVISENIEKKQRRNDVLFLVIVGVCSLVGILGLVSAAIFWYKIQKRAEAALDAEYPSYGVTGPSSNASKISPSSAVSDRKLAQSAQMFHYQQQRQQMMAQEKAHLDAKPVHSDDSDDEAPGGGDYTVYECPGLAPTGEMEVRNPLFAEPDSSLNTSNLASHPTTNNHYPQLTTTSPSSSPPKEKSLS
jgi:hypothetical protein